MDHNQDVWMDGSITSATRYHEVAARLAWKEPWTFKKHLQ